jgi:acetoacetate decarboxylase
MGSTMGYKHRALDTAVEARKLAAPNFLNDGVEQQA